MSKTAQRKRQAYQEGLRHGEWGSGLAYARHPFMAEYRKGYEDGRIRRQYHWGKSTEPAPCRTWLGRLAEWLSRRFA